jgi:hypothetical protein
MHLPRRARRVRAATTNVCLAAALLAWQITASAEIYRYVDENGEVVYSQTPPPDGNATTITPAPGPSAAEAAAARERLRRQLEERFDRRSAEDRAAEEAEQEAARAEQRKQNCRAARTNLTTLQNLGPRRLELPDGRVVRPNAEQHRRLIEDAQGHIRDHCD